MSLVHTSTCRDKVYQSPEIIGKKNHNENIILRIQVFFIYLSYFIVVYFFH